MSLRQNQNGFSVGHLMIALIIIGALGFAGWRVYKARYDKKDSNATAKNEQEKTANNKAEPDIDEEALQWKLVESRLGGFSVRVPDGWKVLNYAASDNIRAEHLTYVQRTPATTENLSYAYAGDSVPRFSIRQFDQSYEYSVLDGDEEKTAFKAGDLEGTRYYKKYPVQEAEGVGAYPGMEAYTYEFLQDGKKTYVNYNIFNDNQYIRQILSPSVFSEGDKNQVELVERMIATLEIH